MLSRVNGTWASGVTHTGLFHTTTDIAYSDATLSRNITLILAKEKTMEAVKDALVNRRTIAYGFDQIAGEESLIKDLFNACVTAEYVRTDSKGNTIFNLTNMSSLVVCGQFKWIQSALDRTFQYSTDENQVRCD